MNTKEWENAYNTCILIYIPLSHTKKYNFERIVWYLLTFNRIEKGKRNYYCQ